MPKVFAKAIKSLRKTRESDRSSSDKETEETFHIRQLEKDLRTLKEQHKLEKDKHRETKGLLDVAELCNKQLYEKLEKEEKERLALEIEVQMLKEKLVMKCT